MIADEVQRPWEQAEKIWTRYRVGLIALSLTLLGAALRLYHIDTNGFNQDEAWAIWLTGHDFSFVVRTTGPGGADPSTPPLYFMLMWFFTQLGHQSLWVRTVSVLAGAVMVWLTFRLAMDLFDDLRIATLSALLVAVSPILITWSRVARAYTLSSLWVFISLYLFALLLFKSKGAGKWIWLGLVLATAAAVWTHYLNVLVILFENAVVGFLWLRRRASRALLPRWFVSQALVGIMILPALLAAYNYMPETTNEWWTRPGLQALVKSAILFNTGDPSYGPIGPTPARFLSLLAIMGVWALALWVFIGRGYHRRLDGEGRRILYLIGAALVPLTMCLAISMVHPLYAEKYYLFIVPLLFIVLAWAVTRARRAIVASLILLTFVALVGSSLHVYYSEPFGEQWREAVAYMRPAYEPDDLVIIAPGWYGRPFAYYFYGGFPQQVAELADTPGIVAEAGDLRPIRLPGQEESVTASDSRLAAAQRIWLVSGYSPVDSAVEAWVEQEFEPVDIRKFTGVTVRLLERTRK
jgi:4-amino-4-deoxy-L-arabinose transferase-like glycosyltransferase